MLERAFANTALPQSGGWRVQRRRIRELAAITLRLHLRLVLDAYLAEERGSEPWDEEPGEEESGYPLSGQLVLRTRQTGDARSGPRARRGPGACEGNEDQ